MRRSEAERLFDVCDDDGNGMIELDEFLSHYDDLCGSHVQTHVSIHI